MKNVDLKMFKKKGTSEEQELVFSAAEVTEDQGNAIINNMFTAFGINPVVLVKPQLIIGEALMTGLNEVACGCAVQAEASIAEGIAPAQYHPHAAPLRPVQRHETMGYAVERETPEGHRMIDDVVIMNTKEQDLKAKQEHELAQAKTEPISRQLPIVGQDERSSFSIADDPKMAKLLEAAKTIVEKTPAAQKEIDGRPAHVVTGVKVIDDGGMPVQTFRVRCSCPACGWIGNRYIRRDNTWAKCYNCNIRLAAIPATNQPMVPDAYNNFFVANEEYIDV